jgi:hypothetical protein
MGSEAPNFIERIVCLANSRKVAGRCVAGKRMGDQSWLRPISDRPGHEISKFEQCYPDRKMVHLFDVVEIPCVKKQPCGHQSENVLIDDRFYWKRKGRLAWKDVLALVDQDADLWVNGFSAYHNRNNRVPARLIDEDGGSLRLIKLDEIVLYAGSKTPGFGNRKLTPNKICT